MPTNRISRSHSDRIGDGVNRVDLQHGHACTAGQPGWFPTLADGFRRGVAAVLEFIDVGCLILVVLPAP
jgi:hypothetical protein